MFFQVLFFRIGGFVVLKRVIVDSFLFRNDLCELYEFYYYNYRFMIFGFMLFLYFFVRKQEILKRQYNFRREDLNLRYGIGIVMYNLIGIGVCRYIYKWFIGIFLGFCILYINKQFLEFQLGVL